MRKFNTSLSKGRSNRQKKSEKDNENVNDLIIIKLHLFLVHGTLMKINHLMSHKHILRDWYHTNRGFPTQPEVKNLPLMRDTGSIPGSEDTLEKGMATHSSILTW